MRPASRPAVAVAGSLTSRRETVAERGAHHSALARERYGVSMTRDCVREIALRGMREARKKWRPRISLLELRRSRCLIDRGVLLSGEPIMPSEMDVDDEIERVDLERATTRVERFARPSLRHEEMRMPVVRVNVRRIECQRAAERLLGLVPPPEVVNLRVGERSVRFRQGWVDLQRFHRGCVRLWERVPRRKLSRFPGSEGVVDVGDARVREREERIDRDRALEKLESLQCFARSAVPMIASAEIQVVRGEIVGGPPNEGRGRLCRERDAKCPGNRSRETFLEREHVSHLANVAVGPELAPVARIHESCGDSDS